MTIEREKRILWRIREAAKGKDTITTKELKRAVMYECGTNKQTIRSHIEALETLGFIKRIYRYTWRFNKDDNW